MILVYGLGARDRAPSLTRAGRRRPCAGRRAVDVSGQFPAVFIDPPNGRRSLEIGRFVAVRRARTADVQRSDGRRTAPLKPTATGLTAPSTRGVLRIAMAGSRDPLSNQIIATAQLTQICVWIFLPLPFSV
jgi:hypothetical protein